MSRSGSLIFDLAMQFLAPIEGKFSDNPADKGGQTKWGISQFAHPDVWPEIHSLDDAARLVYWPRFWQALELDKLTPGLAVVAFDWAVHSGVGVVRKSLLLVKGQANPAWELQRLRFRFIGDGTQRGRFTQPGFDKTTFLEGHLDRLAQLDFLLATLEPPAKLSRMEVQKMPALLLPANEPKPLLYARRGWAFLLGILPTVVTLAGTLGWHPTDPNGVVSSLDGIVQSIFGALIGGLSLWSYLKPDKPKV